MSSTGKRKKVKSPQLKKEFKQIDALFAALEKNKKLPTFGKFFVDCVLLGIEERVNLRVLYPKVYMQVRKGIDAREAYIKSAHRI